MATGSAPVVDTRFGKVRGTIETSVLGGTYCAFKGIPYAEPPIGELRFADPVFPKKWSEIRDCTNFGSECAQVDPISNTFIGSEDCLYLNIYANSIDSNLRKPVIFWIHGGAFSFGSGNDALYGPDYLLRKDVIVVTFNYRLGVFGFLNLEDESAPGNQGLKDQVLALQWVHDNIENFGGNSENVTLMGESAGSASVHYICISPLAKGLFQKAILQSGVALNPWTFIDNPVAIAHRMCEMLGNKTRDPKALVSWLRKIDSKKLIEAQEQLATEEEAMQVVLPFCPSIDKTSKTPFLPIHPEAASENGIQVPIMIGFCKREGLIMNKFVGKNYYKFDTDFAKYVNPNTEKLLKKYNMPSSDLKRLYCSKKEINNNNREDIIDMMGDIQFVEGIHRLVKLQAEKSCAPTYLYRFSYDKGFTIFKLIFQSTDMEGTCHAEDLSYLFAAKLPNGTLSTPMEKGTTDYKLMELMTDMWVNFAAIGTPTPEITETVPLYWQPVNNGTVLRYLNIDYDLRMESVLNLDEKFKPYVSLNSKCEV